MKHEKIVIILIIIGSFFGIVFAFTQQARYPYPAASPTKMCETVQNVEQTLIDLTIPKEKAISLARSSMEFEKNTFGYKIENTQVKESFSFNVFSCSFPNIENVNVGFLLNNGTESHVLILLEDPSVSKIESVQEASIGEYDFFKQ